MRDRGVAPVEEPVPVAGDEDVARRAGRRAGAVAGMPPSASARQARRRRPGRRAPARAPPGRGRRGGRRAATRRRPAGRRPARAGASGPVVGDAESEQLVGVRDQVELQPAYACSIAAQASTAALPRGRAAVRPPSGSSSSRRPGRPPAAPARLRAPSCRAPPDSAGSCADPGPDRLQPHRSAAAQRQAERRRPGAGRAAAPARRRARARGAASCALGPRQRAGTPVRVAPGRQSRRRPAAGHRRD